MPVIQSQINQQNEEYQHNLQANSALVEELVRRQAEAREGGRRKKLPEEKLLPRERVERLVDTNTPFLELSPLAACDMYSNESPGAGQITGIGFVSGVQCLINANDYTIKGGALYPISVKKLLRAQDIARENRLPCIYLVESAGANLLYQGELFAELGGRTFANQIQMSAAGIPQISLVFGNSTAGGAYIPGLSDYSVMVRNRAKVFLGGPPLVKMATGEEVDDESLGGASMHSSVSGLCDYIAVDDTHAIAIGRDIMRQISRKKNELAFRETPQQPHYPIEELLGIVSADPRIPFDIREVIARLVDGSRFLECKPDYGPTLVCGHAHIDGYPVGIIANNGVLFPEAALKGAQFIQLCNQSRHPLLYLQNITGFIIGKEYERAGIVKHGAKMINAVANSNVPQFTIIVGGSYGAGNYAMCGRAYDPRLLFTWPMSRIAVMGAEQAAGVLAIVQEQAARRSGREVDHERIEKMRQATIGQFQKESSCYYATARLWDDGILDPRDTRMALSIGLAMCYSSGFSDDQAPRYGTFRM